MVKRLRRLHNLIHFVLTGIMKLPEITKKMIWLWAVGLVGILISAIINHEVQTWWAEQGRSWALEFSSSWIVFMIEALGGFPGGVLLALVALFVWDQFIAARFENKVESNDDGSSDVLSVKALGVELPKPEETTQTEADFFQVDRDDFDLQLGKFSLLGTRTDDGIRVTARMVVINKGRSSVHMSDLQCSFSIDGAQHVRGSAGLSTPLYPGRSLPIDLGTCLVLDEDQTRGALRFELMFGLRRETMRTKVRVESPILDIEYPADKTRNQVMRSKAPGEILYLQRKGIA